MEETEEEEQLSSSEPQERRETLHPSPSTYFADQKIHIPDAESVSTLSSPLRSLGSFLPANPGHFFLLLTE